MEQLIWETAEELDQKLAQRVRNIRKRRLISQEKLASLSGVSYGSIKRFEATGQISLISLTKIAMALDIADELRNIFTQVPYRDIQEQRCWPPPEASCWNMSLRNLQPDYRR